MLVRKNASPHLFSVLGPSGVEGWGHTLWGWTLPGTILVGQQQTDVQDTRWGPSPRYTRGCKSTVTGLRPHRPRGNVEEGGILWYTPEPLSFGSQKKRFGWVSFGKAGRAQPGLSGIYLPTTWLYLKSLAWKASITQQLWTCPPTGFLKVEIMSDFFYPSSECPEHIVEVQ